MFCLPVQTACPGPLGEQSSMQDSVLPVPGFSSFAQALAGLIILEGVWRVPLGEAQLPEPRAVSISHPRLQ